MCREKRKVYLIGIGMGAVEEMTMEAVTYLRESDCVIGAKRMIQSAMRLGFEKTVFESYQPREIKQFLKEHKSFQSVSIVLSGDSGFYSGAKSLTEELKDDFQIIQVPGICAIAALAAKLGTSWEDAKLVSIHGRNQNFISAVVHHQKVFLLLGNEKNGKELCDKLVYYGLGDVKVTVGSNLSCENEQIVSKRADELTPQDVSGLSVAMIVNPHPQVQICRHIADEELIRGNVPMTKEEVRILSIAKLELTERAVLYDVGAGTGSVGIEAALQNASIQIYAVEKNPEGVELIRKNAQKFQTDQIQIVEGKAPEVLEDLEPPTHVFIGGSSGNLKEIIACVRRKNAKVHIVINAISLETLNEVLEAEKQQIIGKLQITQVMVSRAKKAGQYHMMHGQNPIYIISQKEEV
ncbi:MAG: precorrin-6y C5,15-methyltransferase (decarboxylating) subunit CbiE [Hespellia sp.]|nr:precorrin-6y C5,15-methyltransferase (decarboxylating) subunit CbiE [Hespellia sp.]